MTDAYVMMWRRCIAAVSWFNERESGEFLYAPEFFDGNIQLFNPVERLCYLGQRGMGTLEFQLAMYQEIRRDFELDVAGLIKEVIKYVTLSSK